MCNSLKSITGLICCNKKWNLLKYKMWVRKFQTKLPAYVIEYLPLIFVIHLKSGFIFLCINEQKIPQKVISIQMKTVFIFRILQAHFTYIWIWRRVSIGCLCDHVSELTLHFDSAPFENCTLSIFRLLLFISLALYSVIPIRKMPQGKQTHTKRHAHRFRPILQIFLRFFATYLSSCFLIGSV